MEYLTVSDVIGLHDAAIDDFGGTHGILDIGLVESAVEQARQTFDGEPLYRSIEEVAAAYWHSLTVNHGFADGNKRVGAMSAAFFLELNGHCLDMDDDQIIAAGLAMAGQGMTRTQVFELVAKHVKKR